MDVKAIEVLRRRYLKSKGLPIDIAITFDDVLIVDRTSRVERRSDITDLGVSLARDIRLSIPIVSANMADITEARMAITLARLGGCGFIHQFLPIEQRVEEVKKVKRADNEIIENPWTVGENDSLLHALRFMKEKETSGVLVVNKQGVLVGILTARDIRFVQFQEEESQHRKVKEVMTREPLVTAPPNVGIDRAIFLLQKNRVEKLPLIDAKGKPVGLITAQDILKRYKYPKAVRDKKGRLVAGAAIGVSSDYLFEAGALIRQAEVDVLLIDTARANSVRAARVLHNIRMQFPNQPIVAGNVDNAEGAAVLIEAGVNCIKVGIGPGSACKTRVETGVGAPQLTAIAECAAVAKRKGISVIADGGVREGGDLAKALVAGADCVMLGGLLAGTAETPGELIFDDGQSFKYYRGSASLDTQLSRRDAGGLDRIRAAEGVRRMIPYKGQRAEEAIGILLENLRSSMSYADASNMIEFQRAMFRLQSQAGCFEGKPKS